jgi:hypothetical protein
MSTDHQFISFTDAANCLHIHGVRRGMYLNARAPQDASEFVQRWRAIRARHGGELVEVREIALAEYAQALESELAKEATP